MEDFIIEMTQKTKTLVSCEEFIDLWETKKREIKSTRIVPPTLGNDDGFGLIEIEHSMPVYERVFDD